MKIIILLLGAVLATGCRGSEVQPETFAHEFVETIEVENIEVESIEVNGIMVN